jgi:hypothetical protein
LIARAIVQRPRILLFSAPPTIAPRRSQPQPEGLKGDRHRPRAPSERRPDLRHA